MMRRKIKRHLTVLLVAALTFNSTGITTLAQGIREGVEADMRILTQDFPLAITSADGDVSKASDSNTKPPDHGGDSSGEESREEESREDESTPEEDSENKSATEFIKLDFTKEDLGKGVFNQQVAIGAALEDVALPKTILAYMAPMSETDWPDASPSDASPSNATPADATFPDATPSNAIEISVDHWKIVLPEEGAEFNTKSKTMTQSDEAGNETAVETGEPEVPSYTFVPVFALPEGYDYGETMFEEYLGIEDYLQGEVGITVDVGTDHEAYLLNREALVEIALNELVSDVSNAAYTYVADNKILTLTQDDGSYRLYRSGAASPMGNIGVKFEEGVTKVSILAESVPISSNTNDMSKVSAIDFTNVKTAALSFSGDVSVAGGYGAAGILVPLSCTLDISSVDSKSSLTVKTDEEGVALGSMTGVMGTVTIQSGDITIDGSASKAVGIGSYEMPEETEGSFSVKGGNVKVYGGYYKGGAIRYPVQAVALQISAYSSDCQFAILSTISEYNQEIQMGTTLLRGLLKQPLLSSATLKVTGSAGFSRDMEMGASYVGFVTNVPGAGTYKIGGTDNHGLTYDYMGKRVDDSSPDYLTDFSVEEGGSNTYNDMTQVFQPVFWKDNAKVEESKVTLTGSVDTQTDASKIAEGIYNKGNQPILDKGFAVYQKSDEGTTTLLGYYNANGKVDEENWKTFVENSSGAGDIVVVLDSILEPGQTYDIKPYALTEIGLTVAEEYNVDNSHKTSAVIEITMPKINFPTKLEFTYGTMTDDALNRQEFQTLTGAANHVVTVKGVKITFDESLIDGDVWGGNIPGRFRLNKTKGTGWSKRTVDAGTHQDFVIEFLPENEQYRTVRQTVSVVVTPKQLTISDVDESSKTKVYDGTTDVTIESVILGGIITPEGSGEIEEKDDVYVDRNAATFTASYDTAVVGDDKTITMKNLALAGSRASNYALSQADATSKEITGSSITKREITIKPVAYTKKIGEQWNKGKPLEVELTKGSMANEEDLMTIASVSNANFKGVPEIDAEEGMYTVSLQGITSSNYEISTQMNTYTVTQDSAVSGVNGNFGISGTRGENDWYRSDVTIKAVEDAGYNLIQEYTFPAGSDYLDQILLNTDGTNELRVRLKNGTTGAYTKESDKLTIKIDKELPVVKEDSIDFTDTGENPKSIKDKILTTVFGNFYKAPIRVTMTVADTVSGVNQLYYKLTADGTESTVDITEAEDKKSGTVSFDIPLKQIGDVTFRVTDQAGNFNSYEVKTSGNNYWIVENTAPTITVITNGKTSHALITPITGTDGKSWYTEQIDLSATANDPGDKTGSDPYSGIREILISQGGTTESFRDESFTAERINSYTGIVKSLTADTTEPFTVTVDVTDNAGNAAEQPVKIENIRIDATNPILSSLTGTPATDTNEDVSISFTASDATSGLYSVEWKLGEQGNWTTIEVQSDDTYSFSTGQNGIYYVRATDHVGHISENNITIGNIDKKAPEISSITAPNGAVDGWYNADSLTFTVNAVDHVSENPAYQASGVESCTYTVTYSDDSNKTYTHTMSTKDEDSININVKESGIFEISATVEDGAGNRSATFTTSQFQLDNHSPILIVTPSDNVLEANQWTNEQVTFKLKNTTANQIAGTTFYVSEGNGTSWQTLTAYVDGKDGYTWKLTDKTGKEGTLTITANMNSDLKFKAVSGSAKEAVSEKAYTVRLTVEAPTVKQVTISPRDLGTAWYAKEDAPVVTITSSEQVVTGDHGSAPVTTHYTYQRTDDGSTEATKASFTSKTRVLDFQNDTSSDTNVTMLQNGQYTVQVWAEDAAGNESHKDTYTFNVDDEKPVVNTTGITYQYRNTENNWVEAAIHKLSFGYFFNAQIRVTVPVTDNVSGNEKLHYTLKATSGDETTTTLDQDVDIEDGNAVFTIPLNSEGYIRYYAADQAGNAGDTLVLGVDGAKIWITEAKAPTIPSFEYSMMDLSGKAVTVGGTTWYTHPVTVSTTVTDNPESDNSPYSGLASLKYQFGTNVPKEETNLKAQDGGRLESKRISQVINAEGKEIAVSMEATDNAGNSDTYKEATLYVDLNAPRIGTVTRTIPEDQYTNQNYSVTFSVEDAMSGIATVTVNNTAVTASLKDSQNYEFTVTQNGTYTIKAVDQVGHESTQVFTIANIDKSNPIITKITAAGDQLSNGIYNKEVTVTITGEDATATTDNAKSEIATYSIYNVYSNGSKTTETLLKTGSWNGSSVTHVLEQSGTYQIKAVVTDHAGNTGTDTYGDVIVINNENPDLAMNWQDMSDVEMEDVTTSGKWLSVDQVVFKLISTIFDAGDSVISVSEDEKESWTDLRTDSTLSKEFTASKQGTTTYYFKNTHKTSAKEAGIGPYIVKRDNQKPTAPTYSVNGSSTPDQKNWYHGSQPTVTIVPPDPEAREGVDSSPVDTWFTFWREGTKEPTATKLTDNAKPVIPTGTDNDGTWNLRIWTQDEAGNQSYQGEGAPVYQINTDTAAPVIDSTMEVTPKETGSIANIFRFGSFYNTTLKVTVTVTDSVSKVDKLDYVIANMNGGKKSGTAAHIDEAGQYTFDIPIGTTASQITLKAYDVAGNTTDGDVTRAGELWTVETEQPEVKWQYNKTVASATWYHEPVAIEMTVSDVVSGLNLVQWKRGSEGDYTTVHTQTTDGGKVEGITTTVTLGKAEEYQDNGTDQRLIIHAKDNSGNENTYESAVLKIDTVKPVIAITDPEIPDDWVSEPWQVNFTVSDVKAGIITSLVQKDTIEVWKTVGNAEPVKVDSTEYFQIAETDSSATDSSAATYTGWFKADENGTYVIKAKDVAGNAIESSLIVIEKIDTTTPNAPTYQVTADGTVVESGAWVTKTPVFTVKKPEDNTVSELSVNYKLWKDGTVEPTEKTATIAFDGTEHTISIPDEASADGIWNFKVWSENEAHTKNPATPETFVVKVDREQPQLALSNIAFNRVNTGVLADVGRFLTFGNFFKEGVKVSVPLSDESNGSGLKTFYYKSQKNNTNTIAEVERGIFAEITTFTIDAALLDAAGEIVIYASDFAGNTSSQETKLVGTAGSTTWVIESNGPVIGDFSLKKTKTEAAAVAVTDSSNSQLQWYTDILDISAVISDTGSGINNAVRTLITNGGSSVNQDLVPTDTPKEPGADYTYSETLTDGKYQISIHAEDNAKNAAIEKTIKINIDTTDPVISAVFDNTDWAKQKVVTFTLEEAMSGIDETSLFVWKTGSATSIKPTTTANTYTFTATENGTYTIDVKDNAGNTAQQVAITFTHIDQTAPEAPSVEVVPGSPDGDSDWYKNAASAPKFTITTSTTDSGTAPVTTYYKLWNSGAGATEPTDAVSLASDVSVKALSLSASGTWNLKVWASDEAGNEAGTATNPSYSKTIKYDGILPVLTTPEFRNVNGDAIAELINKLTFGTFFKESVDVWIPVTDDGTSLYKELKYKTSETEAGLTDVSLQIAGKKADDTSFINLPVNFDGYVQYYALDNAGNSSAPTMLQGNDGVFHFVVDSAKPTISDPAVMNAAESTEAYSANENGWYRTDVWVKAAVTDAIAEMASSGLSSVVWTAGAAGTAETLFGSPTDIQSTYSINKQIGAEGTTDVILGATDNAGNVAESKSVSVKIDKTKPTIGVTKGDAPGPVNDDITVEFTITDAVSEVDLKSLKIQNTTKATQVTEYKTETLSDSNGYKVSFTVTENANFTIDVEDNADNPAVQVSVEIKNIDKSALKSASVTVNGEDAKPERWYNGAAVPTIQITNPTVVIGEAKYQTYYYLAHPDDDFNGTDKKKYTILSETTPSPVIPNVDGTYRLYVYTTKQVTPPEDSLVKTYVIKIDRMKPVLTPPVGFTTWQTAEQKLTFTVADERSGVDGKNVKLEKSGETTPVSVEQKSDADGTITYDFTTQGNGTYTMTASDIAGNQNTQEFTLSYIDTSKPGNADAAVPNADGTNSWYKNEPTVTITPSLAEATEGQSGIHTYYHAWSDGSSITDVTQIPTTSRKEFDGEQDGIIENPFTTDGRWQLIVWAQDEAGNVCEEPKTIAVNLDTVNPAVSDISRNPDTSTTGTVTVSFTATDVTSLLNHTGIVVKDKADRIVIVNDTTNQENVGSYTGTFTVSANDVFTIGVTDSAGNSISQPLVTVDNIAAGAIPVPEVQMGGYAVKDTWYKDGDSTQLTISKQTNPTDAIQYKTIYTLQSADGTLIEGEIASDAAGPYTVKLADGTWTVTAVTARNTNYEVDRSTIVTKTIKVDTTKPEASSVVARAVNDNMLAKAINYLTFGNFFNEAIRVTVTVSEVQEAISGPKTLFYLVDTDGNSFNQENALTKTFESGARSVSFDVAPEIQASYIKFKVDDHAGNRSDLYKVTGEGSAERWTLDNSQLSISDVKTTDPTGTDSLTKKWNHNDVTIEVVVANAISGLEKVDGIYKVGDSSKTENEYTRPDILEKKESVAFSQTVSAEGTTIFDIDAKDNASNEKRLSSQSAYADAETRAIRIDKTKPTVSYVAGNPTEWHTGEVEITFTVTDHAAKKLLGTDYSGVDPSVKDAEVATSICVKKDGTYVKATQVSHDVETNQYTFQFRTMGNGTYSVSAKDYASNQGNLETPIVVTKINSAEAPKAPQDGATTKTYGYVTYDAIDGEQGYYKNVPDIQVFNSIDFVVNSETSNTVPVETYYKLWNSSVGEAPEDTTGILVGYDTQEGNNTPTAGEASLRQSIVDSGNVDGTWNLEVWNKNETGETSEKVIKAFKIDTTMPVISEITPDSAAWVQEQEIAFTVTDPGTEAGIGSDIDYATVSVDLTDSDADPKLERKDSGNVYTFTAAQRGSYVLKVKDMAGNDAKSEIVVLTHISTEVPANAAVTISAEPNGEADSEISPQKWYRMNEDGTRNEPVYTVENPQPDPEAAPVTTYYKLWQGDWSAEETVTAATTSDAAKALDACREDGQWNLHVWTISESGVRSAEEDDIKRTIYIDNQAPDINPTPLEFTAINDSDWAELINKLSFGLFFKKAIQVTVEIEDVTSHGDSFHYEIQMAEEGTVQTGNREIVLDKDDKTKGTVNFTLPVDTKGTISMWAADKAGNSSENAPVWLSYEGVTYWEIEDSKPQVTAVTPANGAADVQVTLEEITLTFNEWINLKEGGKVLITSGDERYEAVFASPSDAIKVKPASPSNAEPGLEDVHEPWEVTIPLTEFLSAGQPIELKGGRSYMVSVAQGAFTDLATNENNYVIAGEFMTQALEEIPVPEISSIDIELPEGALMDPSSFNSKTSDYMILIMDNALNGDQIHLAKDLTMTMDLQGVNLERAVLTDLKGNRLNDNLWDRDSSTVVIPANAVKRDENYFIKITISKNGKEQTYNFFVSTSAITAVVENVGSSMSPVDVDREELLASMESTLIEDALRDWKVALRFRASAISETAAGTELEAALRLMQDGGNKDTSIGFYPLDLSVTKYLGRTGTRVEVAQLEKEITIRLTIPESIRDREIYGIYRYHDSVVTQMPYTLDEEKTTATIESDQFSVYTIAYDAPANSSGDSGGGGGGGSIQVGGQVAYYGGSWVNDGYVFTKSDGTKPSDEWLSIDGKIYRFTRNGFRTTKYQVYRFAADGSLIGPKTADVKTATGTWMKDGWWYQKQEGGYLSGGWFYLFYNGKFDWYYFDKDGWMLDGWFEENGKTYYLHTVHDQTRGHMYTGWQFIGGKWYYFRTKGDGDQGALMRSATTPDGHDVDQNGVWNGIGTAPVKEN